MAAAHRTSITIHPGLFKEAQKIIQEHHFANFSDYVSYLIRSDVEAKRKLADLASISESRPQPKR